MGLAVSPALALQDWELQPGSVLSKSPVGVSTLFCEGGGFGTWVGPRLGDTEHAQ